jgi:hypothetical protein
MDCSVYEVPQARLGMEDIEVVIPDLLVVVKIWLELGASMEGKAVDGAVFLVSTLHICFFPIEDIADVVSGDLVFSIIDNDWVVVGLPKAVLDPVATWMFWVIGVFLLFVLARIRD